MLSNQKLKQFIDNTINEFIDLISKKYKLDAEELIYIWCDHTNSKITPKIVCASFVRQELPTFLLALVWFQSYY